MAVEIKQVRFNMLPVEEMCYHTPPMTSSTTFGDHQVIRRRLWYSGTPLRRLPPRSKGSRKRKGFQQDVLRGTFREDIKDRAPSKRAKIKSVRRALFQQSPSEENNTKASRGCLVSNENSKFFFLRAIPPPPKRLSTLSSLDLNFTPSSDGNKKRKKLDWEGRNENQPGEQTTIEPLEKKAKFEAIRTPSPDRRNPTLIPPPVVRQSRTLRGIISRMVS